MTDRFKIREFVRWSDVDAAGIICYGSYVRFFEIVEIELFRSIGLPYSKVFDRFDMWLPRARMHFDFHSPAKLDDLLEGEGWVGRLGRSSIRLNFATYKIDGDERTLTADGYVVMVATDRVNFRPIPLPEDLVAALAKYVEEAAGCP